MEEGNICSVSVFFVRVGIQISPGPAKIQISPPLGEPDQSNALPRANKDNQIPIHALTLPLPPTGMTLIGALVL